MVPSPYAHVNDASQFCAGNWHGSLLSNHFTFGGLSDDLRLAVAKIISEAESLPARTRWLTDPAGWNIRNLLSWDQNGPVLRKPRARVWAEVNSKDSLTVLWQPVISTAPASEVGGQLAGSRVDYLEWAHGGSYTRPPNSLIHLPCAMRDIREKAVRDALDAVLHMLLRHLNASVDVSIGSWVEIVDGEYRIRTAREREQEAWEVDMKAADEALSQAEQDVNEQLAKLGGLTLPMYQFLAAAASIEPDVPLSRRVFEATGKKVAGPALPRMERLVRELTGARERWQAVRDLGDLQFNGVLPHALAAGS